MSAKQHYANHLGDYYSWMIGNFDDRQNEQELFFRQHHLLPSSTKNAIDLGAGNGIHAVPLARLGFDVIAIDFNPQLLAELKQHAHGLAIEVTEDDILHIRAYHAHSPELVLCCGDTITHLSSIADIKMLVRDIYDTLVAGGKLLLSFRDYSHELTGNARFIPVKSDDNRIASCFLEYSDDMVRVTDILYERSHNGWTPRISSYEKVRVSNDMIVSILWNAGFEITTSDILNRMTTIIAQKNS